MAEPLSSVKMHNGNIMCLYKSDKKSEMYFNGNAYTDILNFIWFDFVQGANIVFDLGANYGQFVLNPISKDTATKIEAAYCFEPNPKLANALNESLKKSELEQLVKVVPLGVSNDAGKFDFFINLYSSGGSSLDSDQAFNPLDGIYQLKTEVQTIRLDDFANKEKLSVKGKSVALKIDVEGSDFLALEGALPLLADAEEFLLIMETGKSSAEAFEKRFRDNDALSFFSQHHLYVTYQNQMIKVKDFYDYFSHFKNTRGSIDIVVCTRPLDSNHYLNLAKSAKESMGLST
ncbi:FkbM family methyltransferase [Alteromonas sp. a30]|uniref:FkbM family methyltransferase n=1 Tax=Alteromonas sp. a30 TaxID=2730917 RepID=UPI0022818D78|nr:FkbM family methyltransferase [Alteromonas sp. a30]MCY7296367.1 FkbM family methyltransferase [Alteromonas sp. a30]